MTETVSKSELYTSAQNNFKKLLEVAFSSEINSGQPLDDPQILQKIQEMTNSMNEPSNNCYVIPQLFKDSSEGNFQKIKEHIDNCCDVNEIGPDGETALACAINANNFQIVELLLKSGANPNIKPDKVESTPLMDAANVGYTDIVRILLDFGGNPDVKSSTNNTALHYAACGGHLECCKLLLQYSGNPQELIEDQNENGHTALMEATTSGFLEMTKFLVENGAQINTPSAEFKETALTLASYKGYSDIVQYLLEAGADHEHRTDEMHTALMEASMEGHIDAARVLLFYGAQVNMRADSFESPLTLAACSGHTELAAHLIAYGADVEEVNDESYTPLMEAAREGHLETVAMLLSLGAGINRVTEETQETAMTLAACGGFYDIVLLLHRCGADLELGASTPLMEAAQEGHLDIVKALLTMGTAVDAGNSSDETSLHFAAENGHLDVCRYLLERGADIHHVSDGGKTALMKACRAGNLEVVLLLVDQGARIDQLTTLGEHNALSMACANGHCKIVEYLLQAGADPTVKLKDNCTVLIEASRAGHIDVIEILLRDNRRDRRPPIDFNGAPRLSPPTTATSTPSSIGHDHYDLSRFSMKPAPTALGEYAPLATIYGDRGTPTNHLPPQFNSCTFSSPPSNSDAASFSRPLVLPTEIPDPPLSLPPLPPPAHKEPGGLPLSLFGSDGDRLLLQNVLEQHSPHLEDWVKYMCPALSGGGVGPGYEPLSRLAMAQGDGPSNGGHFHRKIKKAKHSDSYNAQIDLMLNKNCAHACQHRLLSEKPEPEVASSSCGFHRCAASAEVCSEDTRSAVKSQKLAIDCNQNGCDSTSHMCRNCNKSHVIIPPNENQLNILNYPPKKNLFSTTNSGSVNKSLLISGTPSSIDSGVFSIDKSAVNTPVATSTPQENNYLTTDNSSLFNSVTPTSISPIKPKIINQSSSTPFQKQVLQPKRRLQQSQRSPISTNTSLSTSSSFCSEHKISPHNIKLSESFFLPPSSMNGTVLDASAYSAQDSSVNYSGFNFPEKSLTLEERDAFFHQAVGYDHPRAQSVHSCPLSGGMLAPGYHHMDLVMSRMNGGNVGSYDNGRGVAASYTDSATDNLEPVDEIDDDSDSDGADDGDYESERDSPPYIATGNNNNNTTMATATATSTTGTCCNKQHCKKKLNVNVCTELLQESPLSLACSGGHLEVVRLLISSGAKLEHKDKKSQTALHVAVLNGHLEVVRVLIEAGADMEAMVDRTKDTALSIACANGKQDIVELLVARGANIEHRNVSDYTPLSLAASGGYVDIVRFLLRHNAEINSRTNSKLGISPLMLAAMNGHLDAVALLLDHGSDINAQIETNRNTALTLACFQGRTDVVALLVERRAYIEHRAKSGLTPLMEAASQGHVEVGRVLIGAGADVNAPPVPASRETALIIAAEKGHTEFVRLLLQQNAVVDARNKKGDTPLWLACNGGFIDVVRVMVEAGADVNSADNRRMTCLMAAFRKGHVKVVNELVRVATQFPSEHDCLKHLKSIRNEEKDLVKKCETCKEMILKAKERQEYEAAKNAKDLLKQVEEEKKAKEQKEVKQAKKREKKKAKKKAKHDDKDDKDEVFKGEEINAEEEILPMKGPIPVNVVTVTSMPITDCTDLRIPQNNENINPDHNTVPSKSSKRSRAKQDLEKNKPIVVEESKLDKYSNEAALKCHVSDVQVPAVDTNKATLSVSNDISGLTTHKNGSKTNSWIEIGPTKLSYGSKLDESSNWQKIGGSKKKIDIQVNKKDIGKVIGQGGSVVNAIRHITGAHIDIDSMANEFDERTVHLKGTLEAVAKAKDFICDLVDGSISGSAVIKESEPFASKAAIVQTVVPVPTAAATAVARQNGKVAKFGYTKSPSSSLATATSLQYGFSKAGKSSDFATVAAAAVGLVPKNSCPSNSGSVGPSNITINGASNGPGNCSDGFPGLVSPERARPPPTPLEVCTDAPTVAAPSGPCKPFPLAPGSERSLHQRTYNSTPEHSPHAEQHATSSEGTVASSTSDRDEDGHQATASYPPLSSGGNCGGGGWSILAPFPDQAEPLSMLDFEVMSRFPKLQSLNPKAEAFSPSMVPGNGGGGSGGLYGGLRAEDFYYSVNGTLTLNPTASIFRPRHQQQGPPPPQAVHEGAGKRHQGPPSVQAPGQAGHPEERPIRLQDHITMAINILLRNNGFDHHMAEAAFSSFMRSANLDLNTRLSHAEFTALINSVISQGGHQPPVPAPVQVPVGGGGGGYRHQSPAPPTHWPLTAGGAQSIWAPVPTPAAPSPFFPGLGPCLSAQAAFNSSLASFSAGLPPLQPPAMATSLLPPQPPPPPSSSTTAATISAEQSSCTVVVGNQDSSQT